MTDGDAARTAQPRRPAAASVPADAGDASLRAARVFLRPIADPFALGFFGLAGATITMSGLELGWIPASERTQVALIVMIFAPALQVIASIFGYLGRDPVAATGMGVLAVTWELIGVTLLVSPPHSHSPALATLLFLASAAMLSSATTAALSKLVPALVMGVTGLRFFTTALYELLDTSALKTAAGLVGCVLAALAVYGALALEIEGVMKRPVLPTLRHGPGRKALDPNLSTQVEQVAVETGVRAQT